MSSNWWFMHGNWPNMAPKSFLVYEKTVKHKIWSCLIILTVISHYRISFIVFQGGFQVGRNSFQSQWNRHISFSAEFAVRRFSQSWAQVSPFRIIVCSHLTAPNVLNNSTNFPYLETGYSVTMATLGKQTSRRQVSCVARFLDQWICSWRSSRLYCSFLRLCTWMWCSKRRIIHREGLLESRRKMKR